MQKEFTIQVRFCIDKARYGRDKIFLLKEYLKNLTA